MSMFMKRMHYASRAAARALISVAAVSSASCNVVPSTLPPTTQASRTAGSIEAQEDALKEMEPRGLFVYRDKSLPGNPVVGFSITMWPQSTISRLHHFTNLRWVAICTSTIPEGGLHALKEELAGLPALEQLGISGPTTDAGMKELVGLVNLRRLELSSSKMTDAGLKEICRLRNLRELVLSNVASITDAGAAGLKSLRDLKRLDLRRTNITPSAVEKLREALPEATILTGEWSLGPSQYGGNHLGARSSCLSGR